ncbi:MAG TPA: hypothetical protein VLA93_17925 [Pyrinomonadaceae bacterium]|nr:hypothetical protein [Pyrinomonadaceae bacterium]
MRINWSRFVIGALVATVICFFSDGFMHERLLANDWKNVYGAWGITEPQEHSTALIYFFIFEIGRGVLSMFLYVLMPGCCGAGPKTAVFAAIAAWFAFSLTAPAQFIPLGFFSNQLWLKAGAIQLVTSIIATLAGAALYKDARTQSTA